jgi:hypothetical protein
MKDWCILKDLYEISDDDSLGIKTCQTVGCHLLNCVLFDCCVFIVIFVNSVTKRDETG